MSLLDALDMLLLAAVVVTAVVAVAVPHRAAATAAFLVFGIILSLLWGRIGAPDVAMAEAALGGGVAGALLADALERRRPPHPQSSGRRRTAVVAAAVAGAAVFAGVLAVVRHLPSQASGLGERALDEIGGTGVSHPVTAVLLSYRNLDTLLEIAVVAIAAYGAGAVVRETIRPHSVADPVRRTLAIVLVPVLLVLAIWLLVAGTSQPGGAFQSGALLGAALIIAHVCGIRFSTPRGRGGTAAVGAGVLAFILLASAGFAVTGDWLRLDPPWAGAAILAIEAVLAVSIGVALAMIFLAAGSVDTTDEARPDRSVTPRAEP